jgi:hypothetical protein
MGSKGKDKKLSGTDSEQEVSEFPNPLFCLMERQPWARLSWLKAWSHLYLLPLAP